MAEALSKHTPGRSVDSATSLAIGAHIQKMRHQNGWTLSYVSDKTGIPVSALSKFENAKQSMNYVRLLRLAELYEVELGQLLEHGAAVSTPRMLGRRSISKIGGVSRVEDDSFADSYLATDLLNKAMTPILCTTRIQSIEEWTDWSRHVGEEFVFVLEGQLIFHSEMYAPVQLEVGESIYFDAEVGHGYIAGASGYCRFLSVCQSSNRIGKNANSGRLEFLSAKAP